MDGPPATGPRTAPARLALSGSGYRRRPAPQRPERPRPARGGGAGARPGSAPAAPRTKLLVGPAGEGRLRLRRGPGTCSWPTPAAAQRRELQRVGHHQHPLRRVRRTGESTSATHRLHRRPAPPPGPGPRCAAAGRWIVCFTNAAACTGIRATKRRGRPGRARGAAQVLAPAAHRRARRASARRAAPPASVAASAAPFPGRSSCEARPHAARRRRVQQLVRARARAARRRSSASPTPDSCAKRRPRGLVVGLAEHRREQRRDPEPDQLVVGVVARRRDRARRSPGSSVRSDRSRAGAPRRRGRPGRRRSPTRAPQPERRRGPPVREHTARPARAPRRPCPRLTSTHVASGSRPSSAAASWRGSRSASSQKTIGSTTRARSRRSTVAPRSWLAANSPGSSTASKKDSRARAPRFEPGLPHRAPAPHPLRARGRRRRASISP